MNTWQLQEAKSKFSKVVENVVHDGPQIITKHGAEVAVVLSVEVRVDVGIVQHARVEHVERGAIAA